MKTIFSVLLSAVLLMVCATKTNAQESQTTDQVTLNIKLHQIKTLVVNPHQKKVDLEYKTKQDYETGVTLAQQNHLNVFSTGAFVISAKATSASLTGTSGNDKTIDVADVKLTASNGSNNELASTFTSQKLSTSDQPIVSSTQGGRDLQFNIEYAATGNDAYLNHYISKENPTVYTAQVTYTITTP